MHSSKRSPHAHEIKVRRPAQLISDEIPRYWYGGEPFATHFLDALSSTFPLGEAFFVRSVLYYRDRIDDPVLLAEIRTFAAQEGQHSRVHSEHVDLLIAQGYSGIVWLNQKGDRATRWMNRRLPLASLVSTAALEHLTSILARQVLTHPERFTDRMNPSMAALWRWHALEEAEHKSVAFDVMRAVRTPHRVRVLTQIANTLGLSIEVLVRIVYMLHKDGILFSRRGWRGGFRFLWGREALLRGTGAAYLAWYRRDFHPDDEDDRALLRDCESSVEQAIAVSRG